MDSGEATACTCAVATGPFEASTCPVTRNAGPSSITLPACWAGALGTVQTRTSAARGVSLGAESNDDSGTVETLYVPGSKSTSNWPSGPAVTVRTNDANTPGAISGIVLAIKVTVAAAGTELLPEVT